MAKGRLRVVRVIPGAARLAPVVQRFCRSGDGVMTAFSDTRLQAAASLLPEESGVEALPYGRLVTKFLQMCGDSPLEIAQSGLIHAALQEAGLAQPEGSPFRRGASFRGLHRRNAHTLKELGAWGIFPADLAALAERCDESVATRALDVAAVGAEALATLGFLGRTLNESLLARSLTVVPPKGVKLGRVLLLGGSEYTPAGADWILWAVKSGANVTVVVESPAGAQSLFLGARALEAHLGVECENPTSPGGLLDALFTERIADGPGPEVRVQSAADPLAEVEWALRGCREDIRDHTPATRIGIFARDVSTYAPLLEASSVRLGLPLRMARRTPLLSNGLVRLTLACLDFLASDDVRTIAPLVRSSYAETDRPTAKNLLAAAADACRDAGSQWDRLRAWSDSQDPEIPWFRQILGWRDTALATPATAADWNERLRRLLDSVEWPSASVEGAGGLGFRDTRAHSAMRRSLSQWASVQRAKADEPIPLGDFVALCAHLWEDEDASLPMADFGVRVFSSAEAITEVDVLYVVGMLEGVFPRRRTEDPILGDAERAALSAAAGLRASLPDSHDDARAERDEFYRACAAPSMKLVFSYPQTEEDRDNVPAFYLFEAERAMGGRLSTRDLPRAMLTPSPEECLFTADADLAAALSVPPVEPPLAELTLPAALEIARVPPSEGKTPAQVRAVLECPFLYLARHRLKVRSNRRSNLWASLARLPQAVGLATIAGREEATAALQAALDADIESHFAEMGRWERSILRAGGRRLVREWVAREFDARDLWPRTQGSVRQDVRFGEEGISAELPAGEGATVRLAGVIPFVAKVGDYLVAHIDQARQAPAVRQDAVQDDMEGLEIGLYLFALFSKEAGQGVEIDSMRNERHLYTLHPSENPPRFRNRAEAHLAEHSLGRPNMVLPDIKRRLLEAARRWERAAVETRPGPPCDWCDLGELCRDSKDFGERGSPFNDDEPA